MKNYFFRSGENTVIDGTIRGSAARFINHSCDPNCKAEIVQIEGLPRIVYFSQKPIQKDEEVIFRYLYFIKLLELSIPISISILVNH